MSSGKDVDVALDHKEVSQAAGAVTILEEDVITSKWQAIKHNPKVFGWCLFAVWTVLLVSFENQAAGIVLGIPQFRKDFGTFYQGDYVLPANWQSAFSGAPVAGQVIGALGIGPVADMLGRKWPLVGALALSYAAITLELTATTNPQFFGGKFLNGFAVGSIQAVTASYIGEISPTILRGLMTCLIALSYTVGPFIVALIINETGVWETRWAYRAIFAAQYGFAAVSTIFVFFMPESPWWLARKHTDQEVLKSLARLGYPGQYGVAKLANVKETLEEIRKETEGVTYLECFRKSNLRRTVISIGPLCIMSATGIVFAASYSTYYTQLAGFDAAMSFKIQITQQVLSISGNICSWYLVDKLGRRDLTIYSTISLTVVNIVMGGLAVDGRPGPLKGTVAMLLLYCFLFNVGIGATSFTIVTEVATSRLRVKTCAIGFAAQNAWFVMWQFVLPFLFNPDKLNLGGKMAFIYAGLSIFCIIYLYIYQPETAGRTYEELDEMFMKHIPARKFKGYVTEVQIRRNATQHSKAEV